MGRRSTTWVWSSVEDLQGADAGEGGEIDDLGGASERLCRAVRPARGARSTNWVASSERL